MGEQRKKVVLAQDRADGKEAVTQQLPTELHRSGIQFRNILRAILPHDSIINTLYPHHHRCRLIPESSDDASRTGMAKERRAGAAVIILTAIIVLLTPRLLRMVVIPAAPISTARHPRQQQDVNSKYGRK